MLPRASANLQSILLRKPFQVHGFQFSLRCGTPRAINIQSDGTYSNRKNHHNAVCEVSVPCFVAVSCWSPKAAYACLQPKRGQEFF